METGTIIALLTIASLLMGIIIIPVINLNKSITKLNDSIDRLNDDNSNLKSRVDAHGKEIDENTKHLIRHDKDIEHLKEHIK